MDPMEDSLTNTLSFGMPHLNDVAVIDCCNQQKDPADSASTMCEIREPYSVGYESWQRSEIGFASRRRPEGSSHVDHSTPGGDTPESWTMNFERGA
jgi:hypothetical protein